MDTKYDMSSSSGDAAQQAASALQIALDRRDNGGRIAGSADGGLIVGSADGGLIVGSADGGSR